MLLIKKFVKESKSSFNEIRKHSLKTLSNFQCLKEKHS